MIGTNYAENQLANYIRYRKPQELTNMSGKGRYDRWMDNIIKKLTPCSWQKRTSVTQKIITRTKRNDMLRQIEINKKVVRLMYGKRNSEELMDYVIEKTGNKYESNYEDQCHTLQRQVEEQKEEISELLS